MNELLKNEWFISIGSSIIMLAIVPIFTFAINSIRARRGIFSGRYIAITTINQIRIIELVYCRQIRNEIKGKIYGVAFIENETSGSTVRPNNNIFKFKGSVDERLLVISYKPIVKGDISAGTLALLGNSSGNLFSGKWNGYEGEEIISSSCKWIKSKRKLNLKKDYDYILDQVKTDSLGVTMIMMNNGSGKSGYYKILKELYGKADK